VNNQYKKCKILNSTTIVDKEKIKITPEYLILKKVRFKKSQCNEN
jgi:hypothetical protein